VGALPSMVISCISSAIQRLPKKREEDVALFGDHWLSTHLHNRLRGTGKIMMMRFELMIPEVIPIRLASC
jgi:hypothetical protein